MRLLLVATTLILLLPVPPAQAQDAKRFWKDFIRECAGSDLISGNVLYMGLDNVNGPGTVFRKKGSNWNPGPRFDANVAPEDVRKQVLFVHDNPPACSGQNTKKTTAGLSLVLQMLAAPFGGKFGVDINRARSMSVQVTRYAWDYLLDPTFGQNLQKYSALYRQAALTNYVISRALRIEGFEAQLQFDNKTKAELEAKYKGAFELGGGFKGEWTNAGDMKITSPTPFYIAAQMSKVNEQGFQGAKGKQYLQEQKIAPTDKVVPGDK
jgi:hypothetical protein